MQAQEKPAKYRFFIQGNRIPAKRGSYCCQSIQKGAAGDSVCGDARQQRRDMIYADRSDQRPSNVHPCKRNAYFSRSYEKKDIEITNPCICDILYYVR